MSLRREWRLFLVAMQFLTRLPTPRLGGFEPEWIGRSARWFSLVGQVVGLIAGGVLLLAGKLWGGAAPALLAVAAGVLATGALHEDGLADTADGLGGGATREARLAIMKDSRVGTYGVLALGLVVALRVAALAQASPWRGFLALLAASGMGRAAAAVAMAGLPYAGDATRAKAGASPQAVAQHDAAIAVLLALWPFALFDWRAGLAGLGLGAAGALMVVLLARRLLGGRTGDVLGAVEQLCEAGVLLGATLVFR